MCRRHFRASRPQVKKVIGISDSTDRRHRSISDLNVGRQQSVTPRRSNGRLAQCGARKRSKSGEIGSYVQRTRTRAERERQAGNRPGADAPVLGGIHSSAPAKAREQTDRRRSRGEWKPAGSTSVPDSAISGLSLVKARLQAPSGISMESHAGSGAPVDSIAEEEKEKRRSPARCGGGPRCRVLSGRWTAQVRKPCGRANQPLSDSGTRTRGPPVLSLLFLRGLISAEGWHPAQTPRVDESTYESWIRYNTLDRSRVQLQYSCTLFLLRRHDAGGSGWSLAVGNPRAPPPGHLPFSSRGGCHRAARFWQVITGDRVFFVPRLEPPSRLRRRRHHCILSSSTVTTLAAWNLNLSAVLVM